MYMSKFRKMYADLPTSVWELIVQKQAGGWERYPDVGASHVTACLFIFGGLRHWLVLRIFPSLKLWSYLLMLSTCILFSSDFSLFYDPSVTEGAHGRGNKILLPNEPPSSGAPCIVFALPTTRELWLSMPEFGEKERIYLFKSYTDLE